jgi:hypothetical protein
MFILPPVSAPQAYVLNARTVFTVPAPIPAFVARRKLCFSTSVTPVVTMAFIEATPDKFAALAHLYFTRYE